MIMNNRNIFRVLHYALLFILTAFFLFPVLWVILSSFKPQSELFQIPIQIMPQQWTFENYI